VRKLAYGRGFGASASAVARRYSPIERFGADSTATRQNLLPFAPILAHALHCES